MITARSLAGILHKETADESLPADASERLVHIVGILSLMQAVMNVGWTEHTNDWDWFLHITADGRTYEAWDWELVDARWPDKPIPLDFVNDRHVPNNPQEPRADALKLECADYHKDDSKEYTAVIALKDITNFHVEEA